MTTPQIALIGVDGQTIRANTLPATGLSNKEDALPVVVARGVDPTQKYLDIPKFDSSTEQKIIQTTILLVIANPNRRYLKIVNNGAYPVELWTKDAPKAEDVGQVIPRGEYLDVQGGLVEVGERISAIYATSSLGDTGVVILEG